MNKLIWTLNIIIFTIDIFLFTFCQAAQIPPKYNSSEFCTTDTTYPTSMDGLQVVKGQTKQQLVVFIKYSQKNIVNIEQSGLPSELILKEVMIAHLQILDAQRQIDKINLCNNSVSTQKDSNDK